jgi:hypothetical protein
MVQQGRSHLYLDGRYNIQNAVMRDLRKRLDGVLIHDEVWVGVLRVDFVVEYYKLD